MDSDANNPAAAATVLVALSIALCCIFIIRRRNPTAKLKKQMPPGPRPLPIIGNLHLLGDLPHRSLQKLSRKYGPIMSLRLGSIPTIVVSSPKAAELFLKTHDAIFASRPRIPALDHLSFANKGFIFAPYGPYWKNMRRLCTVELLSPARFDSLAPMRKHAVQKMVESVKTTAAVNEAVDVSAHVGDMVADMSCRMILGCSTRDKFNLRPIIHETLHLAAAFNISDYVPFLQPLDLQGFNKRLKAARDAIESVFEEIITDHERNTNPENKGSFLDILMSMIDQPVSQGASDILERTNIKAVLLELIGSSYDALAGVVEWAMSELIRYPRVMVRLREELEAVVGPNKMVEESDLPKLSYLEMVMKETLRLHPVSPLLLPHESMEDVEIMGYFIPKKSRIMVNAWALAMDEETWSENVEEFFPERFQGSDVDVKGHHYQHIPFGSGRRGCPALQIGMTISLFVVAQLVHCFRWEMPDGESPRDLDMSEDFGLDVRRAKHLILKPTCTMPQLGAFQFNN